MAPDIAQIGIKRFQQQVNRAVEVIVIAEVNPVVRRNHRIDGICVFFAVQDRDQSFFVLDGVLELFATDLRDD